MSDTQDCGARIVATGVTLTCQRVRAHRGPHSSTTYGMRWRDGGEVLPPPALPRSRSNHCDADDCTLWLGHAGPHGEQEVLLHLTDSVVESARSDEAS